MKLGRKSDGDGYVGVGKGWGSDLIKAHLYAYMNFSN